MRIKRQLFISFFAVLILISGLITVSEMTSGKYVSVQNSQQKDKINLIPLTSSANIRSSIPIAEIKAAETSATPAQTEQVQPTEATTPAPAATPAPQPKVKAATNSITKAPAPKPAPVQPVPATCGGSFSEHFLCLLNNYRVSKGLGKVSGSGALSKVALSHSQWMNETGTFSHTGENGTRLGDRCRLAGITCRGENLAHNAKSPQNLLDMWIASSAHNKILLGGYKTAGLGISGSYITLLMN